MPLGLPGFLVAMFLIFMVDAAIFPALPELFVVLFFFLHEGLAVDPALWAIALTAVGVLGDLAGNFVLYSFVHRALIKRGKMPRAIERAMRRWTSFLLVRDERVILLNRIAPAVPLTGAFIAVHGWRLRLSLAYVAIGGIVKYGALLALAGWFGITLPPDTALFATLGFVVALIAASLLLARYRRRSVETTP